MSLHICRPASINTRRVLYCPTCETRRRFGGLFAIWYGETLTCCTCGDTWTDGEMHERPFAPAWRPKQAAVARKRWDAALTRDEVRAWVAAEMEAS